MAGRRRRTRKRSGRLWTGSVRYEESEQQKEAARSKELAERREQKEQREWEQWKADQMKNYRERRAEERLRPVLKLDQTALDHVRTLIENHALVTGKVRSDDEKK